MESANAAPITRRDADGVAILTIDTPDRRMNVVDETLLEALGELVRQATDDPDTRAIVLASGKDGSFGAGADVEWLPELAASEHAEAFLARVHALMYEIADGAMPLVSAIDGAALGGALELALAGHAIVATPRSTIGLPESTLGLIPGGAGTQLLRRWVSTADAADLLMTGRVLSASDAAERGIVTELVDSGDVVERAVEVALALADAGGFHRDARDDREGALAAIEAAAVRARSGAELAVIEVLRAGAVDGPEAGCAAERAAFLGLIPSRESRARIHLFQAETAIKRSSRGPGRRSSLLGIVGGGQMGSGIAATAVSKGVPAVIRDVDSARLETAEEYAHKVLARKYTDDEVAKRRVDWRATTDWDGFEGADAVVEAVFELFEVKTAALAGIAERVAPDTLIATNTSAIPIGSLASAVSHPERFMGMHFFSPVDRMPLVELIPHAETSSDTVAAATALGAQLGKVPIVVADRPGFFTSRVYARWLIEGVRLLLDGFPPEQIEAEAKSVGFPVGPLQASDEATLDLVVKASIAQVAEPVMSGRLEVARVRAALETLIGAGVQGRRFGEGFYTYAEGRRSGFNPSIAPALGVTFAPAEPGLAGDRLLYAFVSECLLCWDDGTLCHPDDGDVASVLGIGFPRALGGPFHWADAEGLEEVRARAAALGHVAFPTGEAIDRLIETGGSFASERRVEVSSAIEVAK